MHMADGMANFSTFGRIRPLEPSGLANSVMKNAMADTDSKA